MKSICPYCNYEADQHETLDENKIKNPRENDISFCVSCGEVSQYEGNKLVKIDVFSLDKETQKEIKDIEIAWLTTRNLNQKGK